MLRFPAFFLLKGSSLKCWVGHHSMHLTSLNLVIIEIKNPDHTFDKHRSTARRPQVRESQGWRQPWETSQVQEDVSNKWPRGHFLKRCGYRLNWKQGLIPREERLTWGRAWSGRAARWSLRLDLMVVLMRMVITLQLDRLVNVRTIMISNTNTSITTKVPWLGTITKDCVVVVRILF